MICSAAHVQMMKRCLCSASVAQQCSYCLCSLCVMMLHPGCDVMGLHRGVLVDGLLTAAVCRAPLRRPCARSCRNTS